MSSSNCCFLSCIQVSQEAGQLVWYSHLFQNFPQFIVIHTVKDFGIVNNAEIDVFLELSFFFDDPTDVGNLISGFSAFSKTRRKHLLISWLQSLSAVILEPRKEKLSLFAFSPHLFAWSDGTECQDLRIWMLNFKPAFSFSSFTLIKRLFSSSFLSAIKSGIMYSGIAETYLDGLWALPC